MDGFELAAVYTLQHRLSGKAQHPGGIDHGDESRRRRFDEAGLELRTQADAPGCAGGQLLAGDEAIVEPTM
jgi:hypothetical protein